MSYEKDGERIDKYLGSSPLIENLLKETRDLLHSLTHSGKAQLWRRFDGDEVGSGYSDGEVFGLLGTASSAAFMMTTLLTSSLWAAGAVRCRLRCLVKLRRREGTTQAPLPPAKLLSPSGQTPVPDCLATHPSKGGRGGRATPTPRQNA